MAETPRAGLFRPPHVRPLTAVGATGAGVVLRAAAVPRPVPARIHLPPMAARTVPAPILNPAILNHVVLPVPAILAPHQPTPAVRPIPARFNATAAVQRAVRPPIRRATVIPAPLPTPAVNQTPARFNATAAAPLQLPPTRRVTAMPALRAPTPAARPTRVVSNAMAAALSALRQTVPVRLLWQIFPQIRIRWATAVHQRSAGPVPTVLPAMCRVSVRGRTVRARPAP